MIGRTIEVDSNRGKLDPRIEERMREHSSGATVEAVGKPEVRANAWLRVLGTVFAGAVILQVVSIGSDAIGSMAGVLEDKLAPATSVPITSTTPSPPAHPVHIVETSVRVAQTSQAPFASVPEVPYLSPEFFDVAADVISSNSGLPIDEARTLLAEIEEEAVQCRLSQDPRRRCVFAVHGVVIDFNNDVHEAWYNRHTADGRDLGPNRAGAVQKDGLVKVYDTHGDAYGFNARP